MYAYRRANNVKLFSDRTRGRRRANTIVAASAHSLARVFSVTFWNNRRRVSFVPRVRYYKYDGRHYVRAGVRMTPYHSFLPVHGRFVRSTKTRGDISITYLYVARSVFRPKIKIRSPYCFVVVERPRERYSFVADGVMGGGGGGGW